jgi:isopenicillin N synthase-like dioxygenase
MTQQAEGSQLAECDHIPIIDLSNLNSPHFEDRQKLAQSIRDVCTHVGFFYIKVKCRCHTPECFC